MGCVCTWYVCAGVGGRERVRLIILLGETLRIMQFTETVLGVCVILAVCMLCLKVTDLPKDSVDQNIEREIAHASLNVTFPRKTVCMRLCV